MKNFSRCRPDDDLLNALNFGESVSHKVTPIPDALKTLERRGLRVQSLSGPQGRRYRISLKSGIGYQISEAQLLRLNDENKLNWRGLVETVTKSEIL